MKSLTAVCQSGASAMPAINSSGRISRQNSNHHHHHHHNHRDGENAEMKMYLSKLKDLVPFMPKNRKLSKLEIIQHVIDYICDLQSELETHPDINNFDAATALSLANGNHHHHQISSSHLDDEDMSMEDRLAAHLQNSASSVQIRQPLATRQSPNTILNSSQNNSVINSVILSNSQAAVQQQQQQHQQQQHQQQQYSHATTLIAPAAASTEKQTADNKNSRQHC